MGFDSPRVSFLELCGFKFMKPIMKPNIELFGIGCVGRAKIVHGDLKGEWSSGSLRTGCMALRTKPVPVLPAMPVADCTVESSKSAAR